MGKHRNKIDYWALARNILDYICKLLQEIFDLNFVKHEKIHHTVKSKILRILLKLAIVILGKSDLVKHNAMKFLF